jgi:hypothetical protein
MTGSLPSGGPARALSVVNAYAEAGIQMQSTGMSNVLAGSPGVSWSDPELHAAMQNHFSKWVNLPHWAVWLLHAQLHDLGPTLYRIMFDQQGRQRQGCATFYEGLAGNSATKKRLSSTRTSTSWGTASTCCTRGRSRTRTRPRPTGRGRPRG